MIFVSLILLIVSAIVIYFAKSWNKKQFEKAKRRTSQSIEAKTKELEINEHLISGDE